ncbi:MAG: hypothetical protein DYH12_11690 [Sorangiineae bacterium PRO1]|nr:hypothetical protein [Sorangiineae bacterium PRO1]
MRVTKWTLLLAVLSGCRGCAAEPARESADAADAAAAECEPRTTEKLGIPFSKLCPQDLPLGGARFEPFWIAAQPLGCSAGEHETLRCPRVTPLHHPAPGEARAPGPVPSSLAAVLDANTAQGWCYMRFAGRLPTREERARAEVTLGLAAVIVARSAGEPLHFELSRQAEWVTETPCETPNVANCSVGMFPSGAPRPIPWDAMVACSGPPFTGDAGRPLLSIGESCPAAGFDWDASGGLLPCAVRGPVERGPVLGFALSCKPPAPPERHPEDDPAATAAVRCVMPGTLR